MAMFETWLKSDLQQPIQVKQLTGNLFSADNNGNLIGVEVTNNGEPVQLTDGVVGYVIRSDEKTVIINGTLSGNRAWIVLPASAYVVEGQASVVIKIGTTTVCALICYVYKTTTDDIIDPGHEIPSLEELLAQIENCRQATSNANTAAANANTKAALADEKATLANTAAANADTKASLADEKATLANTAAGTANTAAAGANSAAGKIDNMTVAIDEGSPELPPTATLTLVDGHYVLTFDNMIGDTGNGISGIVMNADYTLTITMTDGNSYTTPSLRGEKGDTGPGATIVRQETEWQNSQSGTTIPSGTWQSSVPSTQQGWYLWTRVTIHWSDGTDTVSYSVSRMGIDGNGNMEFSGYQNETLEFSIY